MGLDLVEITMSIEEELGVELVDDDFERLVRDRDIRVGDLYDLVLEKLELSDTVRNDFGINHGLWSDMHDVLHSVSALPRDQIELKTPLAVLFPTAERRRKWNELQAACRYRIASLDYPPTVRAIGFAIALAMVAVEQFQLWQIPALRVFWILLGVFGLWMVVETHAKMLDILRPFRNQLPSQLTTVKELCRAVLATNYEAVCERVDHSPHDRCVGVWRQLTDILVNTLGVDPVEVMFRARLVRDLRMA
jgi:hypothetical protein